MVTRNFSTALALAGLCLSFALLIGAESLCECLGPTRYYKEIGCTPVFKYKGDCCPERYNCDHLKSLPNDKCLLYGREYDVGPFFKNVVRPEDQRPCDGGCYCHLSAEGIPMFGCLYLSGLPCTVRSPKPGCYIHRNGTSCCGLQVCPGKDENIPTCTVDGKLLRAGDSFEPADDPEKSCVCGPGYTGENVEPFCYTYRNNKCGTMLHDIEKIRSGRIPIFPNLQSPGTRCPAFYEWPSYIESEIIKVNKATSEARYPDMHCKFNNILMRVGDEFYKRRDPFFEEKCIKCVCEVPPTPTCVLFSEDCDVIKRQDDSANS